MENSDTPDKNRIEEFEKIKQRAEKIRKESKAREMKQILTVLKEDYEKGTYNNEAN